MVGGGWLKLPKRAATSSKSKQPMTRSSLPTQTRYAFPFLVVPFVLIGPLLQVLCANRVHQPFLEPGAVSLRREPLPTIPGQISGF